MSKKSKDKAANRKRRRTMLDAAKNEAHNYKALADQYGSKVTELEAEVRKVTAQSDERSKRSIERLEECMRLRETINDLKLIIANLEIRNAEQRGTIMAIERQIDQAVPKVMVKPPMMLSPREAEQFHSPVLYAHRGVVDTEAKHWTAL